jgi:hypothetical protein
LAGGVEDDDIGLSDWLIRFGRSFRICPIAPSTLSRSSGARNGDFAVGATTHAQVYLRDAVCNSAKPANPKDAIRSNSAKDNQDQNDHQDKTKTTAAIIAGAVERSTANAAEAAEQRNDENDKQDCSYRHGFILV